jgi:hypothetical protein
MRELAYRRVSLLLLRMVMLIPWTPARSGIVSPATLLHDNVMGSCARLANVVEAGVADLDLKE